MEVVQITCYASENGAIRLTNGDNGVLQVFYDGEWGYVCDDGWTQLNSNVTCDILGYGYALSTAVGFYDDNTNYLLNLVDCVGNEAAFLDCSYSPYTPDSCFSSEHIYITCLPGGTAILVLDVFSYILISISFISLIISLILFCIAGRAFFRVETNIIYFNYCIAMLLATGIFLFGIPTRKFNRGFCMSIAFVLHYTWLAVFTWTLCIGILIMFKFVISVMSTRKIYPYLIVFGWVFPIIIPIITISITHSYYVNESKHCFLNNDGGVIWALIAPILIILIINAVFLVIAIVKIIYTKKSSQNNEQTDIMKDALITALVLTPVLGIPWLFLLLNVSIQHIALQYIFIFLNGLIGLVFLLVIVLRNKEVRGILKRGKTSEGITTLRNRDPMVSETEDYKVYHTPESSVEALT
ncbi:Neurotrypsin [Oopsacas minuta]|uniref:Neurotrypsin n=1 Tax=Oopsacas minuta TaxID=111878 RepID=A0AAV7KDT9_9METZ|nr:Neurotrypsin [Oopsacas minuta]